MDADTAFCDGCDSLIAPAADGPADQQFDAGARDYPAARTSPKLTAEQAPHVPVVPSRTIDCWSCDTPNTPSRMFCVSCGSFIAIGSKTKPPAEPAPFSGPTPVPGDADADHSLPFVDGVSPLGPYSMEAQRRATRRTRTLTAVTSVVLAMVVGGAALYLASPLSERGEEPQAAAVVAPTDAPEPTDPTGAVSGVSLEPEVVAEPEPVAELEPIEPLAVELAPDLEPLSEPAAEPIVEPDAGDPESIADPEAGEPVAEPRTAAVPELADPELGAPTEVAQPVAEPESVVEPDPIEPEPAEPEVAEPEAEPVAEPEPATQPQPEPVDADAEPEPESIEPAVQPEPVIAAQPESETVAEPGTSDPVRTATVPADEPAAYDGSWVCSEQVVIEDSRLRDWSIGRVSFRIRDGFERVVLQLERVGNGSGDPASITADSMGSWKVEENIPGTDRPGLGRRSITLQLDDGFSGSLGLRGYRPSGLDIIKEFSVYPAGRDGRNVVISADTDGCYRLRVPAWDDPSGSLRRAEIQIDIKP